MKNTMKMSRPAKEPPIELLNMTPVAERLDVRSQVVMTSLAWISGFAPDPARHSPAEQLEMQTRAPQLQAMIGALHDAVAGEDRSPCLLSFDTRCEYLPDQCLKCLAVAVSRGAEPHDFLVLHPFEWWFAEFVAESWGEAGSDEETQPDHSFTRRLRGMCRSAGKPGFINS